MKRIWLALVPLLVLPLIALSLLTWWLAGRVEDELLVVRRRQHADMLSDFEQRFSQAILRKSEPIGRWAREVMAGADSAPPALDGSWYMVLDETGSWRYPAAFSSTPERPEDPLGPDSPELLDSFGQAISYERSNASLGLAAEKYEEIAATESTPPIAKARALLGLARCRQKALNPVQAAEVYRQLITDYANLRDETGVSFGAEASAALIKLAAAQQEPWTDLWRSHVDALLEGRYPMGAVLAVGHLTDALANWPADNHDESDHNRRARLEERIRQLRQMDEAASGLVARRNEEGVRLQAKGPMIILIQPVDSPARRGWAVAAFDREFMKKWLADVINGLADSDRGLLGIRNEQGETIAGASVEPQAVSTRASMSRWGLPWMVEIGVADLAAIQRQGRQRHLLLTGSVVFLVLLIAIGAALGWHLMRREMELSKLKSDFVDNVSHELRTPVTSIKMFSEMLAGGQISDSERQREYYRLLASESNRLARMIDNILNFSRIMAGRMRLNRKPTDMEAFLLEQQEALELQARTSGHQLHLHLGRDLPVCSVDTEAIFRVLANLVSNATKYSDKEQAVVMTAQRRDGHLSIMVRDRGIGIPEQDLPRVFERFFRASGPNGEHIQGTGLGLTIVKETIERHGGTVRIESRPGEGTVVELLFPAELA